MSNISKLYQSGVLSNFLMLLVIREGNRLVPAFTCKIKKIAKEALLRALERKIKRDMRPDMAICLKGKGLLTRLLAGQCLNP